MSILITARNIKRFDFPASCCLHTNMTRLYLPSHPDKMTNRRFLLFFYGVAFLIAGCSNDVEVLAPPANRTIVYALWSAHDSLPPVRIQRSFLNPDQSVQDVAKIRDSIYYNHPISVHVEEWQDTTLLRVVSFSPLTDSGKDAGIFHYPDQPLYRPDQPLVLSPKRTYRLTVKVGEDAPTVSATTAIVGPISPVIPQPISPFNLMRFNGKGKFLVTWYAGANATYYDVWTLIYITEYRRGGDSQQVMLRWPLLRRLRSGPNTRHSYPLVSESFFRFLALHLEADSLITRRFNKMTFYFRGIEQQAYYYLLLNRPSASVNQPDTFYTNVDHGIGLFSSATLDSIETYLHSSVKDSLRFNPIVAPLNFLP